MDDIARNAGVSKKTIYLDFTDKNQLVLESFSAALEQDKCMMEKFPMVKDGIIDHLVGLSLYIRDRFSDFNPLILHEIQRYYPQCWQVFEDFKHEHVYQEIFQLLEKGKEEGVIRPEINSEIIALMRIEQIMYIFDPIKFPVSKFNIVDLQMEIFEHFLFGVFTDKGKAAYLKQKNNN
jgi:TetR/AcrR family transcriptional regulator, cholesterol catabolism regulator